MNARRESARAAIWLALCCGAVLVVIPVRADVRSVSGNILFDVNGDGAYEGALSTTGLGIGTTIPSTNLHVLGNAYLSANLGIGTSAPNSALEVSGTLGFGFQTVTANVSASGNTVVLVDTSSANIQVDLPYAGNVAGRRYHIKKTSSSYTLYVGGGGNYIDSESTLTLTSSSNGYPFVCVQSDGKQWYVVSASNDVNSGVASSNLVGWWKFDETSGTTAADSSSKGNNGTLTGGVTFANNAAVGKVGGALSFDGVNDYVSLGTNALDFMGAQGTIMGWIKYTVSSANSVFSYGDTAGTGYFLSINDNGTNRMQAVVRRANSTDQWDSSTNTNVFTDGSWFHYAWVQYAGTANIEFYVNGSASPPTIYNEVGVSSANVYFDDIVANAEGGALGARVRSTVDQYFKGSLDDFRIYDRPLTADEIKAIYDATK